MDSYKSSPKVSHNRCLEKKKPKFFHKWKKCLFFKIGIFWKVEIFVSVLFFRLKSSIWFPARTHVFERSFFFVLLFVNMWLYFAPARGSPASVSDHVMTSQDYIEVEHVRAWLLSSSFAKFQQFLPECFFRFFLSV